MSSAHEQASAESPREVRAPDDARMASRSTLPANDTLALTRSVVARLPRPSAREIRDLSGLEATRSRPRTDSMSSTRSSSSTGNSRSSVNVGDLINQLQRVWQRQRFRADERAFTRDVEKIVSVLKLRAPPHEEPRVNDGYSSGSGGETSALAAASCAAVVPIEAARPGSRHEDDSVSDADSSSDEGSAVARAPRSPADANVEVLVNAMHPLFHSRYQEVRSLAFEVVNLCVMHYGSQLTHTTRRLVYDHLQDHEQGGDFEPRQRTLRILTSDGRNVEPFQDDLGWLLIDWLEESNEQRDLLNLIQSILRRSPLKLNFDSVIAITSVICGRCDVAWSRGDIESCKRYLAFFHVLATHRLEHALGTSVCLRTLCWMVNADGHGTWSVMKHLLNSSAGFQILRGLVTMLENPMQYNQWILRGAVFFVGMSCWGSQRVAKLDEIKWAPILLALEACLECENGVVIFEIILAIQRLVKKYGDKNGQQSVAGDTSKTSSSRRLLVEWDIILRMLRTLQPWLPKTNQALGRAGDEPNTQAQQRRSNEPQTSQVRSDVPVHMTRIPKELLDTLQAVVDLVQEGKFGGEVEEFYDVLQVYFEYLPESAVRLLLKHRAEASHPAHHADWLQTLDETMTKFFLNRDAPPSIRQETLELLQVNLWSSRNVCEDRVIEEVLLPMLNEVYADPDSTIRRKALDLITEVARTLESVRFDSLLDILENAVHVSSYEDAQICAMSGIVSLFSSYFNHLPHSRAIRMYEIITNVVESHRNWQVRHCALECLLKVCEASSDYRLQWRENQVRTSRFLFCSRRAVRNQQTIPVSHGLRSLLTRISTETHSALFRMAVEGLRRMLCNRLILADIDISDMTMKIISYVDYHAFGRAAIPDEISTLVAEIAADDTDTTRGDVSRNQFEVHDQSSTRSRLHQTHSSTRINPATAKSNLHEASVLLCKTRFTTMGLQILQLFVSYMSDLDIGTRHHLMICCVGVLANPLIVSEDDLTIKHGGSDSASTHSDSGWIWSTRPRASSVSRSRTASETADDLCEQAAFQPTSYGAVKPASPQMPFTSRVLSKLQSSAHSSSLFNVLTTTQSTLGVDKRSSTSEAASRAAEALKRERAMVVKCLRLVFDSEIELLRTAVNTISLLGHIMPSVVIASLDMLLQSARACFFTPEGEFRGDGYAAVIEMIGNLIVSSPDIAMRLEHKAQILQDFVLVAFQRHTDKSTSYLAYRVLCEIVFRCEQREDRVALATAALPLLSDYCTAVATNHKSAIIEAAIDFLTCFALSRSDIVPAPALRVTSPDENRNDQVPQSKSTRSWAHHNAIVSIESRSGKPAVLVVRRANSTTTWHLAMRRPFVVQEPTAPDQSRPEAATPIDVANEATAIKVMMPSTTATPAPETATTSQSQRRKPMNSAPPRPPVPSQSATKASKPWDPRVTETAHGGPSHVIFSPHHLPVPPLPAYDGIGGSPSFFRDASSVDETSGLLGMEQMLLTDPDQTTIESEVNATESGDSTADDDPVIPSKENAGHETDEVQRSELSVSPTVTEQSDGPAHSNESHEDELVDTKEEEQPSPLDVNAALGHLSIAEGTDSLFFMMQLFDSNMEDRPQILAEGASLTLGLSVLDRTPEFETHKIGVLFWRSGKQHAEVDILGNFGGSLRYLKFLRTLGSVTRLEGLHGFSGGMDTSEQHSDGKYTLLYRSHSLQMVFHVATMMTPHDELDSEEKQPTTQSQQGRNVKTMKKKRLIGNDFVHIVFKECDDDYDVNTFSGQFNDVHIIVQPLNDKEYRTQVKCKPGITPFGPLHGTQVIPSAIVAQCVRQTCLNANLACQAFHQEAIGFTMNCEERLKQIKQLGARHATISDEWTLLHPTATSPFSR